LTFDKWPGSRFWAVFDEDGELVCVTVYKKGAKEVIRRLTEPLDPSKCARCGFLSERQRETVVGRDTVQG
jgi:hypothetical protein